ncbi:hypothetical protein CK489_18475 [Bradyrhizobium sp. UFLA03-84]|uniref:DUF3300 domain-containing protein n=1 Tax=Bradyrhizobium sp. UFLA03-84 TaxID=418599 RepID=UPI000BAE6A6D|nr:DUF3300 domain-containing protein [Bradyrhizobium sp. UFLA03-84]PAY08366.1 hypothetical protein CK489_18475 [Bradyrhizobium sp. UFLA03-84]
MIHLGRVLLAIVLMATTAVAATAQTGGNPPAASSQPQSGTPSQADQLLKPEQLEALVAPIALYPDTLLANVLAASTYPLEVVQADRWLNARKNLKGDALKAEVDRQAWDESVRALTSTSDVLSMMSDKIDWTKSLGDAVLAQQADVMDAIQRLRSKAQANNKLVTTKQQKVSVQTQESKQVIVIEQTDPNTVYVPYYDPATVYGAWPYADYPPYYFGYPSYIGAGVIAAGLAFGTGWAIGRWGNYWGGGCNWGNRNVYVNHFNKINNAGNGWQHNPAHRQGVRYNNSNVQQRFGGSNDRAGAGDRMNYRGRDGQQVLKPSGDRPGTDRPGGDRAADRAGDRAGDRGGDRAGDRAKGGDRAGAADRGKGGDRAGAGNKAKGGGDRARTSDRSRNASRGGGGNGRRDGALGNVSSGRAAALQSARGQASLAGRSGGANFAARGGGGYGGGGFRGGGGGGGFRGGGGGGRRSDIALKHDIELLGHLANGLGYYRFSYLGSSKAYVGVMAQEVEQIMPAAVTRGADGYLRVYYDKLGLKFRSYDDWLSAGAKLPSPSESSR